MSTLGNLSPSLCARDYEAVDAKYEFHELHGLSIPVLRYLCVDAIDENGRSKNKIDARRTFFESGATHWGQLETLVQKSHGLRDKKIKARDGSVSVRRIDRLEK